jgi:hypothetical protein
VKRLVLRALLSLSAALVALYLVSLAFIALASALYFYLLSILSSPAEAALGVGVVGLVLAALVVLGVQLALRCTAPRRRAAAAVRSPELKDLAGGLGATAANELMVRAAAHPFQAFAMALLAGLAIGASPELRSALKGLLK